VCPNAHSLNIAVQKFVIQNDLNAYKNKLLCSNQISDNFIAIHLLAKHFELFFTDIDIESKLGNIFVPLGNQTIIMNFNYIWIKKYIKLLFFLNFVFIYFVKEFL